MIAVRKQYPLFGWADFEWLSFTEGTQSVVAYRREWQGETMLIYNNLLAEPVKGTLPADAPSYLNVLTGDTIPAGEFILPAYGFVWLKPLQ